MLDTATLFEVLSAAPRRRLLIALCDVESIAIPEGLRVRGATVTSQSAAPAMPHPESDRVTTSDDLALYHVHLPKLADHGFIKWDRTTQTVSRGSEFAAVEPLLDLLTSNAHVLPNDFF